MLDENQIVKIRWNTSNRKWYESKGYIFTKINDFFNVYAKDLMIHSSAKISAVCDYCGNNYETQYAMITNGRKIIQKDCCPNCTGKKSSDVSRGKRAKKYIGLAMRICEECGYILITSIDDFTEVKMNIEFICPKHGRQTIMLDNFIRGHRCKMCAYEETGNKLKHNVEYVKNCIENINNNKLLNPEEYNDSFTRNLNIRCLCGNVFTTSFINYTEHGVNRCSVCSHRESDGEQRIRKFLELNKIEYIQEKRFDDCKDKRSLPFDFYLPNYNMCIEFDGRQHYEPIFGEYNFARTQYHDSVKTQYCKNNNINLLRISYLDGHNIEDIICKQLNL